MLERSLKGSFGFTSQGALVANSPPAVIGPFGEIGRQTFDGPRQHRGHPQASRGRRGRTTGAAARGLSWAEPLAREALSLSTAVGRLQLIEASSRKLAEALVRQGKKTEAVTHAKRALD